jgi:outer membrane protein TolC
MQEKMINMNNYFTDVFLRLVRKSYSQFLIISIYFIVYVPVTSYSQSDSLLPYLEIAAKNNPGVLQKFTEYKAALQKVPQVGSLPDPELNLGVFLTPMELVEGRQVADLRLMQMFPWFGVLKNAKDEMSLMARAKFELFRDAKLSLFYNIQRTWYELIKIHQEIRISESNVEILKTIERLMLVRFKSPLSAGVSSYSGGSNSAATSSASYPGSRGMQTMGGNTGNNNGENSSQESSLTTSNSMGSQASGSGLADLYRVRIEVADLEYNIATLKSLVSTVTARFNTYMNRNVIAVIALPDTLGPEVFDITLDTVTARMLAGNPMLGMLKFEQQSLDARYRMVSSMGYPMVGIGVNYSLINKSGMSTSSMNGKDMIMPMVTVTLPVYRKKYNAMKSETELLKSASIQDYTETYNSLQAEFYQAVQLYEDATRRQKLYSDQNQLADKSFSIMLKSFSSSGSGLTDLLRIRQQALDYKFKLVEAVADYNTAVAWLRKLGNLEFIRDK